MSLSRFIGTSLFYFFLIIAIIQIFGYLRRAYTKKNLLEAFQNIAARKRFSRESFFSLVSYNDIIYEKTLHYVMKQGEGAEVVGNPKIKAMHNARLARMVKHLVKAIKRKKDLLRVPDLDQSADYARDFKTLDTLSILSIRASKKFTALSSYDYRVSGQRNQS